MADSSPPEGAGALSPYSQEAFRGLSTEMTMETLRNLSAALKEAEILEEGPLKKSPEKGLFAQFMEEMGKTVQEDEEESNHKGEGLNFLFFDFEETISCWVINDIWWRFD